jgi:hypothetical protein
MNKPLLKIIFLAHYSRRLKIMEYHLKSLIKLTDENKKKIVVLFPCSDELNGKMDDYIKLLTDNGISCEVMYLPDHIYMKKLYTAMNHPKYIDVPYSVKVDDDIFMSNHVWDFMIENLHMLDMQGITFIAPVINTGIPSVDYFVDAVGTTEEISNVHSQFKNTEFGDMWGVNYRSLNEATINAQEWNSDKFYKLVSMIPHFWKGIHPVRVSEKIHHTIFDITKAHFNLVIEKNKYDFFRLPNSVYFCNSLFFISTKKWLEILTDRSLFRDDFDEVALNNYYHRMKTEFCFIKNGYAVHPSYGITSNCGEEQKQIETDYLALYKEKL